MSGAGGGIAGSIGGRFFGNAPGWIEVSKREVPTERLFENIQSEDAKEIHRILETRRITLPDSTQSADRIYRTARALMNNAEKEGPFRLIGVGISQIVDAAEADRAPDLLDPNAGKRVQVEKATDEIRKRFGSKAILKGRSLR